MKKEKVMVTGAAGYIGSIATALLLQKGFDVVAVDNFSTGYKEALNSLQSQFSNRLRIYKHNLRENIQSIFQKEGNVDTVFHFAGVTEVDESMKDPAKYFEHNTQTTLSLLSAMEQYNVNKLIFSSTAAVYGEAESVPITEQHPTCPTNPYGSSKLMAEQIIHWFEKQKGIRSVIFRYFNVCGATPDGLLGDRRESSPALVLNAVKGALGIQPFYLTNQLVETPDTTPVRDYIDVVDLADAHLFAYNYLTDNGTSEIINLGSTSGYSVKEIIQTVEKVTGKSIQRQKGKERTGEVAKIIASNEKAQQLLGWKPKWTIDESITSTITWLIHQNQLSP